MADRHAFGLDADVDLRHDAPLLIPVDDGYFIGRVMGGSIRDGGTYMPPFEGVLSQEAIWAIRSWLDTVAEQ